IPTAINWHTRRPSTPRHTWDTTQRLSPLRSDKVYWVHFARLAFPGVAQREQGDAGDYAATGISLLSMTAVMAWPGPASNVYQVWDRHSNRHHGWEALSVSESNLRAGFRYRDYDMG